MTNSLPSIADYTLALKAQRDAYQLKQTVTEQPMSAWARLCNWFDSPYEEPVTPTPASVDNSAALATQNTVNELQTVIAGQSAELAQLRQAVLVLAKSSKSVESNTIAIADDMQVVKAQTRQKIKPWNTIQNEMNKCWREIIDDTNFLQEGVELVTTGRVLRSVLSFGTAAPEAVKQAKREVFAHIKSVRSYRDKLETCYEYAQLHHKAEVDQWLATQTSTLSVDKKSWKLLDAFKQGFLADLQSALYSSRGIK